MDIRKFYIKPNIPEKISALNDLAFNMWSCWDKDAEKLFHRLDPKLFRNLNHNPVELLYRVSTQRLQEAAKDKGFLHELKHVREKYDDYMSYEGVNVVGESEVAFSPDDIVAYTCMEYGLHESVPTYSGGLAILAGDQLKAVSDVGFSMVSFGLLFRYGYFKQQISPEGKQIEEFHENTWFLSNVTEVSQRDGQPLIIEVPLKSEKVFVKLWKIQVGKSPLYLLDTNIHQNPEKFRNITKTLYDSDRDRRLEQELVLGRGSVIALKALGISPKVYHINEGHTAFLILERLLDLVKNKKFSLDEARAIIRFSTVFTTHTPVVEGNEHFQDEQIVDYLKGEIEELGLTVRDFLSLGKLGKEKMFWLPAFAIRYSRFINGVSQIHASVSRKIWRDVFPNLHESELPIDSITNGVHIQSWLSLQMMELFDRYVGPDYFHLTHREEIWDSISQIPDGEIWNAHRRRKEQVVSFVRRRIANMMIQRGYGKNKIVDVEQVLNPDYLTIGFARRMAPYKRANLILNNPDRLAAIVKNPERPVQIIFSGKAHPADAMGKDIIRQIFDFIRKYSLENHVVFLEDYDINIARHIVQGVDVWLNTPVRPMEASGTSGIKAAINGVLNLSILDGWWPEGYNGENGWAIVGSENIDNPELAETAEANHIYHLLENDITDLYYDRTESDIPVEWARMMKSSIATMCSKFNMQRTVREYMNKFYIPQMEVYGRMCGNNYALLRKVSGHKKVIDAAWNKIYIRDYFTNINGKTLMSGEKVAVDCYVYVDEIDTSLIDLETFYSCDLGVRKTTLSFVEKYQDKVAKYSGSVVLEGNGQQEIGVRIVPSDGDFREIYPEYVKWKD